jgi:TolB protein
VQNKNCFGLLLLAYSLSGPVAWGAGVGEFTDHQDVGAPKNAGTTTYNGAAQEYRLTASGTNMWATRDEFQFAFRKLKGDFIVQARVEFIGAGTDPHRKAGWIVRRSLDPDSQYVDIARHGEGLTSLQYRKQQGGTTEEQPQPAAKGSDVLQLERHGNTYIVSVARYGETFTTAQIADFDLGEEPYVGLFLTAHNPEVIEQAVFRDVRIIKPAKPDFVPYKDYIGTRLEILDVESGHRQMVYASKQPFEAPNWMNDGSSLIFNSSGSDPDYRGRLYRFDLTSRQPTKIDTGFAIRNNNDHVLSFDGTMLGISDQSTDQHQSTVFVVPVTGGTPKRITQFTPSYMHSWSPDGKYVVYTGGRNGNFDIYRMPSDGVGKEERLTKVEALDDGPEYSRDGKYIYFNSTRNGKMQIFRMKADGSNQEALTNDEYNNWFPHFSPDGKWISMISYIDEITPTDHPYYKHVYLRLMPAAGGTPKVIAYVYGGQGTINVPSWSPDGKMLAFVSNSDME